MRNTSKTALRAALALAVLACATAGLLACDLFESAQSSKVLAGTVLNTPEYDTSGLIQSQLPDGGFGFDAGGYAVPDGGLPSKVPAQAVAQVFFGSRDPADPTAKPSAVTDAKITLAFAGKSFDLPHKGGGNYALTSLDDGSFVYVPGAAYKLTISHGGETYTADVTAPPAETIAQFEAMHGAPIEHTSGASLQLTRSSVDNVAFTTVFPLSSGGKGEPTYTDAPTEVLDLLDLFVNDSQWKQQQITVPGTAFPQAKSYYLVTVSPLSKGTTSNNLFTTSVFVAGNALLGPVKTR